MSKFLIIFILLASGIFAQWRWPVDEVQLIKNFTPFQPYLIITADQAAPVYSIIEGSFFLRQRPPFLFEGFQSFEELLVIRHSDKFLSIYGNLEVVENGGGKDDPIGKMRDNLFFAIIDQEKEVWVNPEILLPPLSGISDMDKGRWYQSVENTIRPMGNVLSGDPVLFVGKSSSEIKIAPYRYQVIVNDDTPIIYSFDTSALDMFREDDDRLWVSFPLFSLREGENLIKVTASSLLGQEYQQHMRVYYESQ